MLLANKVAVVTGCSRGIGRSTLDLFARNGADVWACYRKPDRSTEELLLNISKKYSVKVTPVYFDLVDTDGIKTAMRTVYSSVRSVDILVNNAGMVSNNALFLMTPIETMRMVFEANFFGQMLVTQILVRGMCAKRSGSVVNVASIAALDGEPGQLEYVASKAALIGATRKLARELGPLGIRVNAVAPGITETDMIKGMSPELKMDTLRKTAMKRLANPDHIAQAILFLASDMSSHVTGQVLRVDGGG